MTISKTLDPSRLPLPLSPRPLSKCSSNENPTVDWSGVGRQFEALTADMTTRLQTAIPKSVHLLLLSSWGSELEQKPVLAGGCIRDLLILNEQPKDYDLFFPNNRMVDRAVDYMQNSDHFPYVVAGIYKTVNAVSVRVMVGASSICIQLIKRWSYEEPTQVSEQFDFTAVAAGCWYEGTRLITHVHPLFLHDAANKILRYMAPVREEDPAGSLLRVIKFLKRGYDISAAELAAVMARCVAACEDEELVSVRDTQKELGWTIRLSSQFNQARRPGQVSM
jgi:hypothetical protein